MLQNKSIELNFVKVQHITNVAITWKAYRLIEWRFLLSTTLFPIYVGLCEAYEARAVLMLRHGSSASSVNVKTASRTTEV